MESKFEILIIIISNLFTFLLFRFGRLNLNFILFKLFKLVGQDKCRMVVFN